MTTLNENIPFLYGELNKLTEYYRYKFESSDNTINISQKDYSVDFKLNSKTLVTLKRIQVDTSIEDDTIRNYGLFAYNSKTAQFDIQLGETLQIPISGGSTTNISEVKIGNSIIPASINEAGQLVLEYLPVNAIKDIDDSYVYNEELGKWEFHESIIDGNAI